MIIDVILDRSAGVPYDPVDKRSYMAEEARIFGFDRLEGAIRSGDAGAIRGELCGYVIEQGYDPAICRFVAQMDW